MGRPSVRETHAASDLIEGVTVDCEFDRPCSLPSCLDQGLHRDHPLLVRRPHTRSRYTRCRGGSSSSSRLYKRAGSSLSPNWAWSAVFHRVLTAVGKRTQSSLTRTPASGLTY